MLESDIHPIDDEEMEALSQTLKLEELVSFVGKFGETPEVVFMWLHRWSNNILLKIDTTEKNE